MLNKYVQPSPRTETRVCWRSCDHTLSSQRGLHVDHSSENFLNFVAFSNGTIITDRKIRLVLSASADKL
jgi:hypothetical protein